MRDHLEGRRVLIAGLVAALGACTGAAEDAPDVGPAEISLSTRSADAEGLPLREGAHLLLITVDALRASRVGAYGYERGITPGIDALAERSVVFDRAYAQAPHSSWSLCSLMTSEYLHETVPLGAPLPRETLASALGEAGYRTYASFTDGIFYTDGELLEPLAIDELGFQEIDHENPAADERTERVLSVVDGIALDDEPPSFLWVHYFDPHEPYRETSLGTSLADRYDGEVRNADRGVARLVEEIRGRLSRDVIVVITADHGEELRDHGGISHGSKLYDEQIRVPLLIDVPGLPARRVAGPVELVDLAPTLLGLLGVAPPSTMRGDDLRASLVSDGVRARPAFAAVADRRMVVEGTSKLIADLPAGALELYDLARDPSERDDLAAREDPSALVDLLHGWNDRLRASMEGRVAGAVALGRLHDDRAIEPLVALLADDGATEAARAEAAGLLGRLGAPGGREALVRASRDHGPHGVEAAVALASFGDARALPRLHAVLRSHEPELSPSTSARAAIAAARLGDRTATEALIDLLESDAPYETLRDATIALYRLRDPRAIPALAALTADSRLRYRAITAMGLTGSADAYGPLVALLDGPRRAMIRDGIVRALGWVGDRRAVPIVAGLAARDPELIYATESLVRLHGERTSYVGGTDVGPGVRGLVGVGPCHREDPLDLGYRRQTWCESHGARMTLPLAELEPDGPLVAVLSARSLEQQPAHVTLEIGDDTFELELGSDWAEHRIALASPPGDRATLSADGRVALDHLLLLPAGSAGAEDDAALDEVGEGGADASHQVLVDGEP